MILMYSAKEGIHLRRVHLALYLFEKGAFLIDFLLRMYIHNSFEFKIMHLCSHLILERTFIDMLKDSNRESSVETPVIFLDYLCMWKIVKEILNLHPLFRF